MINVIWEFVVKDEDAEKFERAYGPDGDWARLFARYPGFRGTTLLRDVAQARKFVTIDVWESRARQQQMLADAKAEYAKLDAQFEGWTESETEIGVFEAI